MLQVHEFTYYVESLEKGKGNKYCVPQGTWVHHERKGEFNGRKRTKDEKDLPDCLGLSLRDFTGVAQVVSMI
ncbi:hypothetical protein GCM10027189_36550 [Rufibacter soli]